MRKHAGTIVALIAVLALAGVVGWQVRQRLGTQAAAAQPTGGAVPVEAAPVERRRMVERRVLTGTLEARSRFAVAPEVAGRIERLAVDLGDPVEPGQVVAVLNNAEFVQAVAQAEADLALARASLSEAESRLGLTRRENERTLELQRRGVATDAQVDQAASTLEAAEASRQVAEAQVSRARANLALAQVRLGYTTVSAGWPTESGSEPGRLFVAERFLDVGDTVQVGTPIVSVVELDPLTAVVYVTERDYASLREGQAAELSTDAYPGESFPARIERLSPVFREASRQARVELRVDNPGLRLKPGMFVRARIVLRELDDAVTVPLDAVVRRGGRDVVFVLEQEAAPEGGAARLVARAVPVEVGVVEENHAEVLGEEIAALVGGRVVTLGQQLLEDGSRVAEAGEHGFVNRTTVEAEEEAAEAAPAGRAGGEA